MNTSSFNAFSCIVAASSLFLIIYYFSEGGLGLVMVKSTVDQHYYQVRNLSDKQDAADLLAKGREQLEQLVKTTRTLSKRQSCET